jgi:hypothetical protein
MSTTTTSTGQGQTITVQCFTPDTLIKAYQDYITFLGNAESRVIGLLFSHGFQFPPEMIEEGKQRRAELEQLLAQYEQHKL